MYIPIGVNGEITDIFFSVKLSLFTCLPNKLFTNFVNELAKKLLKSSPLMLIVVSSKERKKVQLENVSLGVTSLRKAISEKTTILALFWRNFRPHFVSNVC